MLQKYLNINLCLAMNGKRVEINNASKHVVLVSSPLSLFSRLSLFIAILSHLLGLLGTACLRSARFARSRALAC